MNNKKLQIFNYIIFGIYILSAIYFTINKDYAGVGLSVLSLIIGIGLYIIHKKNPRLIDTSLYIVANLFILCSFVLGSSYKLYDKVKFYDDFLHFWSGFIGVKIAWNSLNNTDITPKEHRIIFFVTIFMFAMGISAICEIVEYLLDTYLKMKTQSGGLKDTMQDMIDAFLGGTIMIIYYYNKLKHS
ncbi:MAG: hypothetical protein ACRDA3_06505 [Peptostreptococcaceae bacterium]